MIIVSLRHKMPNCSMSTSQLADLCGVTKATVQRWRRQQMGPKYKRTTCCNKPIYQPEDVREWLEEHARNKRRACGFCGRDIDFDHHTPECPAGSDL